MGLRLMGRLSWDLSSLGEDGELVEVLVLLPALALSLLGELNSGSGLCSGLFFSFFSSTEHTVVSSSVSDTSLSTKGFSVSGCPASPGLSATPPVSPAPPVSCRPLSAPPGHTTRMYAEGCSLRPGQKPSGG